MDCSSKVRLLPAILTSDISSERSERIWPLSSVRLFTYIIWYNETRKTEREAIGMSLFIDRNVDFGTVELADYGYVNFAQGPDLMEFRMSPEAARTFIDRIDQVAGVLAKAWKELKPEESVEQAIYQDDDEDNPGTVIFTALFDGPVFMDGEYLEEEKALAKVDELKAGQKIKVHCDLVAAWDDALVLVELQLTGLEVVE
jgi:hypothetical protein